MNDLDVYAAPNPADARARVPQPPAASDRTLWFAVLAAPFAWAVDELTAIALHHDYCAALSGRTFRPWGGISVLLTIWGILMLAIALAGTAAAWRANASIGSDTGAGNTDLDRRRFMARAGLLTGALFSYAIVLRLIAPLLLSAGFCGS